MRPMSHVMQGEPWLSISNCLLQRLRAQKPARDSPAPALAGDLSPLGYEAAGALPTNPSVLDLPGR